MDILVQYVKTGKAPETAKIVNALWALLGINLRISREQVYKNIALGFERGLVTLTPELHQILSQKLAERFGHDEAEIKVVSSRGDLTAVATRAAHIAVEEIAKLKRIKKPKDRVHVGLGAGSTSARVFNHLHYEISTSEDMPPLTMHALNCGFDVDAPHKSPNSYFGSFGKTGKNIEFVGLFAPAGVEASTYEGVKKLPGIKPAFERRKEIDLIITSLASAKDEHGELNTFQKLVGGSSTNPRRVGDVQYRSYDEKGPLKNGKGMCSVTLFELEELVEMAKRRDKRVLLVAGPCGECGRTREDALRPLLENPALKVWTHLILDLDTADALLK